jgi:DNA polymerase III sliding clamp (beta) subunit (PCNA family)
MKLINVLNACNVIAPAKDVRYYLNGVALHICVNSGKLIAASATDGHQLILATVNSGTALQVCRTVVLSKNDIKLINIKYPLLDVAGFDGVTVSQLSDIVGSCELIDGRYPDITRVLPETGRKADFTAIGANVEYLANISTIHRAMVKGQKTKQYPVWSLNMKSASESIVANQEIDGVKMTYVLMPARI